MTVINISEAESNLAELIERALKGESVYLCDDGNVVVQLTPIVHKVKKRVGGQWKGQVSIAEDFDAPLPDEISQAFKGLGS